MTPVPASQMPYQVQIFFGSDRSWESDAAKGLRFGSGRGELTFGSTLVSVPPGHRMGNLELPRLLRLELTPDRSKHFVIEKIQRLAEPDFFSQVRAHLGAAGSDGRSFVFIHGYNVSFDDAALRTAQLAVDLDVKAVPVFYSWPSQGSLERYPVDAQNAEWTEANLRIFLEKFAESSGVNSIVVIAHSMGTRPASRALARILETRPALAPKFAELVLAAPDIDAEVFVRDILPAYARINKSVTLYASSNDKALQASKKYNGAVRAGDSKPRPRIAAGLEAIDASDIDTDFLGHGYLVESRVLLTDLTLLFTRGLRARDRPGLESVDAGGLTYWRFRR